MLVSLRVCFYRKYNKKIIKKQNPPAGSRNPADPPVPHLESGKSARNKKIAFSRGYPRVPLRNEHAACRLDLPGFCPLRGRFRRGVLLRPGHFPAAPGHGNAAVVQHVIFHSRLQTVAVASRRGNLGFFHHAVHHRHGDAGQRQDNGNHHKQFNQRESLGLTVQKRCLHTLPRVAQLQFRASGKQPAPPISKPVPGTAADGITPVHKHPGAFRQPGCLKRMLL